MLENQENRELRQLYTHPDIKAIIKSRRLRWLGHIVRREDESILKTVYNNQPEGRRPVGRPRLRWNDQVLKDPRKMNKSMAI